MKKSKVKGPRVRYLDEKMGHGLFADRRYAKGELLTTYGGLKLDCADCRGDYVVKIMPLCDIGRGRNWHIDGRVGYEEHERGRWINHSSTPNAEIRRRPGTAQCLSTLIMDVVAICDIEKDEQMFIDYGGAYSVELNGKN
jgi:hypothetical protein